jgi:hypothetical protein
MNLDFFAPLHAIVLSVVNGLTHAVMVCAGLAVANQVGLSVLQWADHTDLPASSSLLIGHYQGRVAQRTSTS